MWGGGRKMAAGNGRCAYGMTSAARSLQKFLEAGLRLMTSVEWRVNNAKQLLFMKEVMAKTHRKWHKLE